MSFLRRYFCEEVGDGDQIDWVIQSDYVWAFSETDAEELFRRGFHAAIENAVRVRMDDKKDDDD